MASFLSNLCTPAFVYLVISFITIVLSISYGIGFASILAKMILVLIWTWFLNYLCLKDLKGLSWFLVLLPYLLIIVIILFTIDIISITNNEYSYDPTVFKGTAPPLNI
jgi:amino acid transporter